MSRRPHDWSPLRGSDPVPGDPPAVARMARHYRDTAAEIRAQAATLRGFADADWDSDAGRAFSGHAQEAAGKLEAAHDRYEVVGSALGEWVGPLEDAQATSVTALDKAKEAHARMLAASTPVAGPGADAPAEQVAAAAAAERQRQAAYDAAAADLRAAERLLRGAEDDRDGAAESLAGRIREVIDHDGLKDSRFDRFKFWVSANAGWIRAAVQIVGWVATAVAVAALFLSGGWVVLLLGGLLVASLIGNTALAVSGEGSWLDVGIDVVGLLTLGLGARLLQGARAATRGASVQGLRATQRSAAGAVRASHASAKQAAARAATRTGATRAARGSARASLTSMKAAEEAAGRAARRELDDLLGGPTGVLARLKWGSTEIAEISRKLAVLETRMATNARVLAGVDEARSALRLPIALMTGGFYVDWAKHSNEVWQWFGNESFIPSWEKELGSSW